MSGAFKASALRVMGFSHPIGQHIRNQNKDWHIIGVMRDFVTGSPFYPISPVLIKGTLSHPSIDVHARKLEIVDSGKAKDADCESLIASADSEVARPHASGPRH